MPFRNFAAEIKKECRAKDIGNNGRKEEQA